MSRLGDSLLFDVTISVKTPQITTSQKKLNGQRKKRTATNFSTTQSDRKEERETQSTELS